MSYTISFNLGNYEYELGREVEEVFSDVSASDFIAGTFDLDMSVETLVEEIFENDKDYFVRKVREALQEKIDEERESVLTDLTDYFDFQELWEKWCEEPLEDFEAYFDALDFDIEFGGVEFDEDSIIEYFLEHYAFAEGGVAFHDWWVKY